MSAFLHIVAYVAGVAVLFVAVRGAVRRPEPVTPGSVVGACVWVLLLAGLVAYDALGMVQCDAPWLAPLAMLLLAGAAATALSGPALRARVRKPLAAVRPLATVVCIPVAFFLVEWPYNQQLFSIEFFDVLLNLALIGGAMLAVWFVCQRRSGALVGFLAACLGVGTANYFVCLFKEQTILPADVLAITTAAEVSGGYEYVLGDSVLVAACVFVAAAALLALLPSPRLTRLRVAFNLVVGLLLAGGLVGWYRMSDIKEDYGVTVDVWSTRESYMRYGTVPCFLQRMQEVEQDAPEGYSTDAALELQAELAAAWDAAHPDYPATLEEAAAVQAEATGSDDLPSVIVIMNESFSDLSAYPGVEGYDGLTLYDAIEAFERGVIYTSARGGGTCNTEFEYLTGSTLGSMGGGVYPYMFYDLSFAESLPRYFSALGYATTAVHPAEATNWRRDTVYAQLGFDLFLSEDDFDEDADTLRNLITDRETYDKVLEVLAEGEGPQFIFDVTLQNHSGYETGLLDEYPYDDVTVAGETIAGMSEYLSCIDASQEDLVYFLEELEKLDRKVIVVFFGDHQPGFNDQVAEAAYGTSVDDLTLEQVQSRFSTPYLIWANFDLEAVTELTGADADTGTQNGLMSTGYLMAETVYAAGLPLTDYQKALLQLREELLAANLNGYCDADGTWYWNGQESDALAVWNEYALLQYANIFDRNANATAFAAFAEEVGSGEEEGS